MASLPSNGSVSVQVSEFRSPSRRTVLSSIGTTLLLGSIAGCSRVVDFSEFNLDQTTTGSIRPQIGIDKGVTRPETMYAAYNDGRFTVPEVPYQKVEASLRRQIVVDPTGEAPGTIVVRLAEKRLYYVLPGNEAIRYGVGIGRDGFRWSGRAIIQYKKEWPTWTPPKEMIARKPEVAKWAGGQPGGLDNPLGARAMYIFQNGQDTGYRVHGSPEWWTIGQAMSSGCVRMINQDVIDLYNRVSNKTPIVVA
ncbi:L,D-transpeptidase [Mesorhizobium sp. RP14(2022)]|uniref:L,D-transpeptidase n=1 Tax=Mesorhizobium liriopis TaxID=2953882 RepID=A0ABT1CC10_9HYPH|nr:L,D-transpeptidase [Mesorhizobium liriopis]MCO6052361.1 L,D-transpeptidase [Mesorhizobium liriopis]